MTKAPNILIIEDEQGIADNITFALELDGFTSSHCLLAADGLKQIESNKFDLAIIDIGLPDYNGFELCRQIRDFSDIPILFLTARTDEVDRVIGFEIGADDYVTKPFSPRELSARVRAILRRLSPKNQAEIQTSDFVINQSQARINYHQQQLQLTRIEYYILSTLLNAPNQIFSREQLMQKVWLNPEHSLDRSVDTHIKNIRAKLKAITPTQQPIKTHRGLGYSLELQ